MVVQILARYVLLDNTTTKHNNRVAHCVQRQHIVQRREQVPFQCVSRVVQENIPLRGRQVVRIVELEPVVLQQVVAQACAQIAGKEHIKR